MGLTAPKPHGYLKQEFWAKRGKGSHRTSKMFENVIRYSNQGRLHRLPDKVRERLKGGPRVASFKYRSG